MNMIEYSHWSKFPMDEWRWPSFSPRELASKGDGKLMVNYDAMDKLQALRNLLGKPIILNSAYRSLGHNRSVGGVPGSQHTKATAFDCGMANHDPAQFEAAAREVGFGAFGFYRKSNFIHIDTRQDREWGTRWFKKADRFSAVPLTDADVDFSGSEEANAPTSAATDPEVLAPAGIAATAATSAPALLSSISGLSPVAQVALVAVLGVIAVGGFYMFLRAKRKWR